MNKLEEVKEELLERGFDVDKSILFVEPSFDDAIIGISIDGNVVYSFDKMIECLKDTCDFDTQEATDFITYNTIPSIEKYINKDFKMPIVVYGID